VESLFYAVIDLVCWLLVAASPLLLGAAVGALSFYLVGGGLLGGVLWVVLTVCGLGLGVLLACHAARQGELVNYAGGIAPGKPGLGSEAGKGPKPDA
jgi:hypothetical protein